MGGRWSGGDGDVGPRVEIVGERSHEADKDREDGLGWSKRVWETHMMAGEIGEEIGEGWEGTTVSRSRGGGNGGVGGYLFRFLSSSSRPFEVLMCQAQHLNVVKGGFAGLGFLS